MFLIFVLWYIYLTEDKYNVLTWFFIYILLITTKYNNIAKANRIKFSSVITKLFNDKIQQICFPIFEVIHFKSQPRLI